MEKIAIVLAVIIVIAVVLLSLPAKSEKNAKIPEIQEISREGKTIVVFWHAMSGPLGDALNKLVYDFNASQEEIYVDAIAMGNYTALSQKIMASIQAGNQPDLCQVYESWTSNMMEGNVIIPVEDFIARDDSFGEEELEDIYPVFINCNTINGKLVTFPFNKSVRVMYYNKDILFNNDLDPNSPPRTWQEFREMCRQLALDEDGDGNFERFGTTIKISAWQFENLLLQAGGEIMNESSTKPLFNSPAGIEALSHLTTLLMKDNTAYISPGYDGQNDFLAGKIVFYEDSSVSLAYMQRTGVDFSMGISAVPTYKTNRNVISGTNVAIFKGKDPKAAEAAWEFVKWFTSAEITARWSEYTYYMPVRRSAFKQENLKMRLQNNPEINSVYQQLENATYEPQIPEWFDTRKYLEQEVIEKVIRGKLGEKEGLDMAADKLTKMLQDK